MSRIGKQPIPIPDKVDLKIEDGFVLANGPKGEMKQMLPPGIRAKIDGSSLIVFPEKEMSDKKMAARWGLARALVYNCLKGVKDGFEKKLEIEGIGFRAAVQGKKLVLNLGFSHPVEVEAPQGIVFKVEKNIISVSGFDKKLVGQVAADLRGLKKPEPYKGKGIRYQGEVIKIKAGKKAVSAGI